MDFADPFDGRPPDRDLIYGDAVGEPGVRPEVPDGFGEYVGLPGFFRVIAVHGDSEAAGEGLADDQPLLLAVVEFKNSDWDKMTDRAVRRNVQRHARQVQSHVEALFEELGEDRFTDGDLRRHLSG